MQVDYRRLGQIAVDPNFREIMAKDTSVVLTNYLYMMSNLNADVDQWSASEMAMITNSLNRWQDRKAKVNAQNITAGEIVMVDLGLNYAPELSYAHPAVVLEELRDIILVIPVTSSANKVAQAYHPVDNPGGKWFYRKVGVTDGFAHDCVLLLSNLKVISKTAILSPMGKLECNLSDKTKLYREVKNTILKYYFHKEWKYTCDLERNYNSLVESDNELKETCEIQKENIAKLEEKVRFLEEQLKNIDNSDNYR